MRKIFVVSLLLASLAVAYGISGAALAQPGAAVDGYRSSIGDSSSEGPAMDGPTRPAIEDHFFFHDDDEDDEDEEDDDDDFPFFDDDEDDDDDGEDEGPPDDDGPPKDDDQEDDDQDEDDQDEDDQEGDDQEGDDQDEDDQEGDDPEDGTETGDGTDTAPPSTASPPEPSSVTVDAIELPPARFNVSAETDNNGTLFAGESVRIDVRVENAGLQDGTHEVALRVDGQTVESETLAVDVRGAETKTLEWRFDEPGGYALAVGNTSLGTVTVINASLDVQMTPESLEPPQSIAVVAATAPADWVREGHRTTVRTTVVNIADRTAARTVPVTVDGRVVALETVTLGPNEVRVQSIDFAAVPGAVAVDGVEAGRIDVGKATETARLATDDDVAGTGIDLGVLVFATVIGTVAGTAGLVVRRRG